MNKKAESKQDSQTDRIKNVKYDVNKTLVRTMMGDYNVE